MNREELKANIIFLPATIAWIIFVPLFKYANRVADRNNFHKPKYSTWFWMNIQVTDHETAYDYED